MKIYDISQEVFSCCVYPGDPKPVKETVCSINKGELYNLTAFSMCTHNGTHIDAPCHFIKDGDSIDMIPLEKTVGMAYVVTFDDFIDEKAAKDIVKMAKELDPQAAKRILIKGKAELTNAGAKAFVDLSVELVGVESQSVGNEAAPMEVHKTLLDAKTVILEGLRLDGVCQGVYFLLAQPLNLAGSDGSPVRAVLVDFGK